MSVDIWQFLFVVLVISLAGGLYMFFEWLVRKWLDLEDCPIPMPGPVRWTLALGAVMTAPCLAWAIAMIL
jgi:hypothetical protein